LAGTFYRRRSRLQKTGFFTQVRELKIQRKNPGSALRVEKFHFALFEISRKLYSHTYSSQTLEEVS
jgi:hypothetical protein